MPIKKDDHALDALRYYLMTRPQAAKLPKAEQTIVQKDKQRLLRARKNGILSARAGKTGV